MADEPLSRLSSFGEPDEAEMARYRRRLAVKLQDSGPVRLWWPSMLTVVALAATIAFFVVLLPSATGDRDLPSLSLAELQAMANHPPEPVLRQARSQVSEGPASESLNALMLLSLSEARDEAVRYAARGVQEDPRPEFRHLYLELLLDQADEYGYDANRIEQLMEGESDRECLRLYRQMLRIAT